MLIKYDKLKIVYFLSSIKVFSTALCILFLQQSSIQTYSVDIFLSKSSGFISFAIYLLLSIIILYQPPLNILKSINIVYKRRRYTKASLCFYFVINYYIDIIFALNLIFVEKGIAQIIVTMLLITSKLIFFFSVMKNSEKIRHICYILIFFGAFCSHLNYFLDSNALK